MVRGTEPLPTALNSAADTSVSSGTSFAGSSDSRVPIGTAAVIERAPIAVSQALLCRCRVVGVVAFTGLTDAGAQM